MTAWLILHPNGAAGLSALLANLAVGIAAYLLSGTFRKHRQILIAWGIQTFTDPKTEEKERAFHARPDALDSSIRAKTARAAGER